MQKFFVKRVLKMCGFSSTGSLYFSLNYCYPVVFDSEILKRVFVSTESSAGTSQVGANTSTLVVTLLHVNRRPVTVYTTMTGMVSK